MITPTLPGTIPGLLRRGSPVISSEHGEGVCIFTPRPGRGPAVGFMGPGDMAQFVEAWVAAEDLALDLSDPTGRAHAAWWLALRECPASHVLDPAAVAWHPAPAQADAGWSLEWQARAVKGCGTLTGHWWSGRSRSPVPASLLWHLVRDDPRLLPDGSRWVDAEALRLVCLHVAGVSRV